MRRRRRDNVRATINRSKVKTGTSLAKRESTALGIPERPSQSARGLLTTPQGAVACELEPTGVDADGAHYELRITNGTSSPLAARATAVRLDDEARPVAAIAVEIEPHAAIRTGFSLDASLAYQRVTAEVHGEGVHLVVDAPPPIGGKSRRRWIPPVIALGAAGLLAAVVLVVFGAARPRVVEAALSANPDGRLVASWAMSGSGSRTFELRDASGKVVAQGPLPAPSGTLDLGRGDAASLHVAIANAFGYDSRDAAYARATAPPAIRIVATAPPAITSLTVDPPQPDAPLVVHYAARARDLHLSIVDRDGKTYFETTTQAGTGIVRIPAPPAGPHGPYELIARAEGASAGEQTRVTIASAVTPSPAPSPSLSPAAVAQGTGAGPAGNSQIIETGGEESFTIDPDPARPGQSFTVEIPFASAARVELVRDHDGLELAWVDLRAGDRKAVLTAPRGGGPFTVRVTIQRGAGTETLVHPLHLSGR
jgi:hypothetical protein